MLETIHKETFDFLNRLKKNNNRDWFNDNKKEFKEIELEVKKVFGQLLEKLNKHDSIEKMKVFRIYRDVRFSKNKLPYKTHLGASFSRTKPYLRGGYYLQIQPNNQSFIATGFWEPNKDDLLRIRREFQQDDQEIREIINNKKFKSVWGDLVGEELKTAPRNFDKEHKAIDLIRKKQFIFTKNFSDKEVFSPDFINNVDEAFISIRPFFDYMSYELTTDLNGVSII